MSNWIANGQGRKTIAFCCNRAHAQYLQSQFEQAGVRTGYIDGDTPLEERAHIKAALEMGEINIILSISAIIAGFDCPPVSCIIFARPTQSKELFVQALGRGLRVSPDKQDCIVFDHTGATAHFGRVETIQCDPFEEDMGGAICNGPRAEPKEKDQTKHCEHCTRENHLNAPVCEGCWSPFPAPVIEDEQELVVDDGRSVFEMTDAELFGQIKYYVQASGYHPKATSRIFQDIAGFAPPAALKSNLDKCLIREPSPNLYEILRLKRQIFALNKRAEEAGSDNWREQSPEDWKAGARAGFLDQAQPTDIRGWPEDRRAAWSAGYKKGQAERTEAIMRKLLERPQVAAE